MKCNVAPSKMQIRCTSIFLYISFRRIFTFDYGKLVLQFLNNKWFSIFLLCIRKRVYISTFHSHSLETKCNFGRKTSHTDLRYELNSYISHQRCMGQVERGRSAWWRFYMVFTDSHFNDIPGNILKLSPGGPR